MVVVTIIKNEEGDSPSLKNIGLPPSGIDAADATPPATNESAAACDLQTRHRSCTAQSLW
jgi:hypothetical protein